MGNKDRVETLKDCKVFSFYKINDKDFSIDKIYDTILAIRDDKANKRNNASILKLLHSKMFVDKTPFKSLYENELKLFKEAFKKVSASIKANLEKSYNEIANVEKDKEKQEKQTHLTESSEDNKKDGVLAKFILRQKLEDTSKGCILDSFDKLINGTDTKNKELLTTYNVLRNHCNSKEQSDIDNLIKEQKDRLKKLEDKKNKNCGLTLYQFLQKGKVTNPDKHTIKDFCKVKCGIDLQKDYKNAGGLITVPVRFEEIVFSEVISKYVTQMKEILGIEFNSVNSVSNLEKKDEQLIKYLLDKGLLEKKEGNDIINSFEDAISQIDAKDCDESKKAMLKVHYKTLKGHYESIESGDISEIKDKIISNVLKDSKLIEYKSDTLLYMKPNNTYPEIENVTRSTMLFKSTTLLGRKVTKKEQLTPTNDYFIYNHDIYEMVGEGNDGPNDANVEKIELLKRVPRKNIDCDLFIYKDKRFEDIMQGEYALFGQTVQVKKSGHVMTLNMTFGTEEIEQKDPKASENEVAGIDLGQKHTLITTNVQVKDEHKGYVNIYKRILEDKAAKEILKKIPLSIDERTDDNTKDMFSGKTMYDVFNALSEKMQFGIIEMNALFTQTVYQTSLQKKKHEKGTNIEDESGESEKKTKNDTNIYSLKDFNGENPNLLSATFTCVNVEESGKKVLSKGNTYDFNEMSKNFQDKQKSYCLLERAINRVLDKMREEYKKEGDKKKENYVTFCKKFRQALLSYHKARQTYYRNQSVYDTNEVLEKVDNPQGTHYPLELYKKNGKDEYMTNGQFYLKEHPYSAKKEGKELWDRINKIGQEVIGDRDNIIAYAYDTLKEAGIKVAVMENLTSSNFEKMRYIPSPYTLLHNDKWNGLGRPAKELEKKLCMNNISPKNYNIKKGDGDLVEDITLSQQGILQDNLSRLYNSAIKVCNFASIKDKFIQMSYRRDMKIVITMPYYSSRMSFNEKENKFIIFTEKYTNSKGEEKERFASKSKIRPCQEYTWDEKNADINAADMLAKYYTVQTLKKEFLTENCKGNAYNPILSAKIKALSGFKEALEKDKTGFEFRPWKQETSAQANQIGA